jgi:DNA-binding MarR family transcriptional regulator
VSERALQRPAGRKKPARHRRTSVGPRARPDGPRAARAIDLDGLNDHLGYLVRRAQLWIFQDFVKTLEAFDIRTAQYSVLTIINANPGLTQMALAHTLGIERARLVHLLDDLEARRLVKRTTSPNDRRSHAIYLTHDGETAFSGIRAKALEHESRLAARVGRKQHKQLLRLLLPFASG